MKATDSLSITDVQRLKEDLCGSGIESYTGLVIVVLFIQMQRLKTSVPLPEFTVV